LRAQLIVGAAMAQTGGRGLLALALSLIFLILRIALLVRVISSWIRGLANSKWVRWSHVLTEPLLRPLRKVIPSLGMIDITPILAYFALSLLEGVIIGAIAR
jgi:YggT family protein